jgi:hypothetical protein
MLNATPAEYLPNMRVSIGIKAHSGWAVAITIGAADGQYCLVDRRRLELVKTTETWAKQPFHAAEDLDLAEAEILIQRGIRFANTFSVHRIKSLTHRLSKEGHHIEACAVLAPAPMPAWSISEILTVHMRMHKAEGVLFPEALTNAAAKCGHTVVLLPERLIVERAKAVFGNKLDRVLNELFQLGKSAGPPWTKDHKNAALAAAIALHE